MKKQICAIAVCLALISTWGVALLMSPQSSRVSGFPDGLIIVQDKSIQRTYSITGSGDSSQLAISIQVCRTGGITPDSITLRLWNAETNQWDTGRAYAWWGNDTLSFFPHSSIENLSADGSSWRLGFQISFLASGVYTVVVHMRDH